MAQVTLDYRAERSRWLQRRYLFVTWVNLILALGWLILSIYERSIYRYGMKRPLESDFLDFYWVHGTGPVCLTVTIVTFTHVFVLALICARGNLHPRTLAVYTAIATGPWILLMSTCALLCGISFE